MVARCWPSGDCIEIRDGTQYHGKLTEPYMKTKEGWWIVWLDYKYKDLYLVMPGEYHKFYISWR